MIAKLIPLHIAQAIARASRWSDGDTWVIGNGRVLEFEFSANRFILMDRRAKTVIGSAPFAEVMARGRERPPETSGPRNPEDVYEDGVALVNGEQDS